MDIHRYCRYLLALISLSLSASTLQALPSEIAPRESANTLSDEPKNAAAWHNPAFSVVAINATEVELRLTGGSHNVRYEIDGPNFSVTIAMSDSGRNMIYRDIGLQPYTTYEYTVRAFTVESATPGYRETFSVTTPLGSSALETDQGFEEENNTAHTDMVAATDPEINADLFVSEANKLNLFSLYPNPSTRREVTLVLGAHPSVEPQVAQVEIVSTTGVVVHREQVHCDGDCTDTLLSLKGDVPPGIYTVNISIDGKKVSRRLTLE